MIKDDMLKNHGYYRVERDGITSSLVCCENGVFRFYPPTAKKSSWTVEQLIDVPASDAVLVDFDKDGEDELLVFSPFHGDTVLIYKEKNSGYEQVYECPEKMEFLHAIWSGELEGQPVAVVGHRKGQRNLVKFFWKDGKYQKEYIDKDCGSANAYGFHKDGKDYVVATNREINEIAMYEF